EVRERRGARRAHGLGPGRGPEAIARRWLRPSPREAARYRAAARDPHGHGLRTGCPACRRGGAAARRAMTWTVPFPRRLTGPRASLRTAERAALRSSPSRT